jgi:branched-chain amino acid transport system substrate-binding protein
MVTRRAAMAALSALALAPVLGRAQTKPVIRIGILQDASGPYSYLGGPGSIACARQAIDEMAGTRGLQVEVVTADHQNKADIGAGIARQWLDQGVDALLEFNNSAIALAVNNLVRERDKVMLANNVGSAALSGKECTPNMTHWTFDTAMLAISMGNGMVEQGGDTWFFIRADYTFGRALRDDTAAVVQAKGSKVIGEVAVPVGTTDFASALLQAQASRAKVVALALAGSDLLNCLKQAGEFGLGRGGQRVAALIIYLQDIKSLGLDVAKGTTVTESFYWDLNDRTRAFAKRVLPKTKNIPPNMGQAGAYSAVTHYLKAVADLGPAEAKRSGRAVVARMKQLPISDDVLTDARVREDGRVVSDVYLFEVKSPEESKSEWDLYKVKRKLGPDQAWRPMSAGGCPLVKT